jgi:Ni/Fe-hydrogenase subunit HybB-like protein
MSQSVMTANSVKASWFRDKILMGKTFGEYSRSLITPWNLVAAAILAVGVPVLLYRFWKGLGATTNLSDINPWGLWLGFDMFFGVAVATGGFCMVVGVYIFGRKDFKPMVRPAVLTGFLGYFFAILGLAIDLGRYWALPLPFIYLGTASVLFLVAEHLALYLMIQFVEFLPAVVEWLNWRRIRAWLDKIHIGAVILGSVLVMGHQSALGAMFLLMPSRLHPLWYTSYIPYLFFASCLAGGIAMLVVESMISHNVFGWQVKDHEPAHMDRLTVGLGKAAAFCLFAYFALMTLSLLRGLSAGDISFQMLLGTGYGWWKLFEIGFGILLPMFLYAYAVRNDNAKLVRTASAITVLGVLVNRFNVVLVGLNYNAPERYFPHWMEIVGSLTLVTIGILIFKWVMNRMPVLYRLPDFPDEEH